LTAAPTRASSRAVTAVVGPRGGASTAASHHDGAYGGLCRVADVGPRDVAGGAPCSTADAGPRGLASDAPYRATDAGPRTWLATPLLRG
jgi:hypothetical protein